MKKIYSLLLLVMTSVSFGQTFYSENMGTTASGNPLITAYTGFQVGSPVAYTGTGDMRTTTPSTGYVGASGSVNVFLSNTTTAEFFQIDGINSSAFSAANLQLKFGYLANSVANAGLVVEVSTNGTTWTPLTYTAATAANTWTLITIGGGAIPSSSTLSIRFTQPTLTAQIRIDDVSVSNVNASCTLSLGIPTTACSATSLGLDPYNVTIPYTGGGSGSYTITPSSGTVSGDNPGTVAAGNIIVTGVTEGTGLTVNITQGSCSYQATATSPECKPVNGTPYYEPFVYAEASNLSQSQQWSNITTGGDEIIVAGGTMNSYPGLTPNGGYVFYGGAGNDASTSFTPQTTGTVYYSFLLNVSTMAGVTSADGGYFAAFGSNSTNFGGTLWTKRVDDGVYNLGIEVRTGAAANTTWTTATYTTGQTYFIVVGYTFGSGDGDDTVSLWVNPALNGAQPAATITDSHTGNDLTAVSNFILRQDSATETPELQLDELRIATDWNFVTSSTLGTSNNTISGLKVYPNPVSHGTLFIETTANAEKTVTIYDLLGKQVLNTTTADNAINVSNIKGGVYVVRITEEGKTATRKLVIK